MIHLCPAGYSRVVLPGRSSMNFLKSAMVLRDLKCSRQYLLKSRDPRNQIVRIVPELRAKVQLRRLNLIADAFDILGEMDVIFCRNVMIYFDLATQEKLIRKFHRHLSPGGYLFIGHAESLINLKTPFIYMAPTIYRKDG